MVKNPPANAGPAGDMGSVPELERSPGGGNGNPLQCSCLEHSMDTQASWATVRGVAEELEMTEQPSRHAHSLLCHPITILAMKVNPGGTHRQRQQGLVRRVTVSREQQGSVKPTRKEMPR